MGFESGKTSIKNQKIVLFFVCVLFLSTLEFSLGANGVEPRKINCRKYVFAPQCRGVAAKRDTSARFIDDYRPPLMDKDITGMDKSNLNDQLLNSRILLAELLRKAIEASPEYDNEGNGNYLK